MADRFWVGGTASWNGTATGKWSTTSGGASGAAEPVAADDVLFDGNSGTGTITMDTTAGECRSFNATGFTGTFTLGAVDWNIGDGTIGHFTLASGMTFTSGGNEFRDIIFKSTVGTNNITTNGKVIPRECFFNGVGGTWQFQDAVTHTGGGLGAIITLQTGTLNTNGQSVSTDLFSSASGTTLTLGSTTFTLTQGDGTPWTFNAGATLTSNTSTISFLAC